MIGFLCAGLLLFSWDNDEPRDDARILAALDVLEANQLSQIDRQQLVASLRNEHAISDAHLKRLQIACTKMENSFVLLTYVEVLGHIGNRESVEWLVGNQRHITSFHDKANLLFVKAIIRLEDRLKVDVTDRLHPTLRLIKSRVRAGNIGR